MGRAITLALMVTLWLGVVAWGAQEIGDGIDHAFAQSAERINGKGN